MYVIQPGRSIANLRSSYLTALYLIQDVATFEMASFVFYECRHLFKSSLQCTFFQIPTFEAAVKTQVSKKRAASQTSQQSFPSSTRGGSGCSAFGRIRNRHPGSMTMTLAMQPLAWRWKGDVPEAAHAAPPACRHALGLLLQPQRQELHIRQCRSRTRMGRAASRWNLQQPITRLLLCLHHH